MNADTKEQRNIPTSTDGAGMRAETSQALSSRVNVPLLAIVAAVLIVRLLAFGYVNSVDPARFIERDSFQYESLALTLQREGKFAVPGNPPRPQFRRTPGYPVFIAGVYTLFGQRPAAVIFIQALLSVGVVVGVFKMTERLFSARAGLYAAAVAALDPLHTEQSLKLMTDSIGTLLTVFAALLVVLLFTKNRSPWIALLCGATLAVATMVRPVSYYLIAATVAGLIVLHRTAGFNRRELVLAVIAFMAAPLVIIGGWQVRNSYAVGSSQFAGITGRNMLHYRAAAVYALRHDVSRDEAVVVLEQRMLAETDSTKNIYERQMEFGTKYVLSDIPGTIGLVGFATVRMMLDPGAAEMLKLFGIQPAASTKGLTNQMSASFSKYLDRWSGGRKWATVYIFLTIVFLGVFYVLSVTGLARWIAGPRLHVAAHVMVLGTIFYYVVVSAGGEALARFRSPFVPLMAVYAGAALTWIHETIATRRRRPAAEAPTPSSV